MGQGMRFPFLTTFDPPGTSEGTIDPLGLYILADQLAGELVPGVRERMQRVRFLTAMVVGAVVTEGLEPNPEFPHTPPFLVWEWLVVEAIVRTLPMSEGQLWGIPGSQLVNNSIERFKYLDERGYLANPRVIGFHGVYKRLAVKLGLLDTSLKLRPGRSEELIAAWAAGIKISHFGHESELFRKWRRAVQASLESHPLRTRTGAGWKQDDWRELAEAFAPHAIPSREKTCLRKMLRRTDEDQLGALAAIWQATEYLPSDSDERTVHQALKNQAPELGVLLEAIEAYGSSLEI